MICQVAHVGVEALFCLAVDSGGMRCERLDKHDGRSDGQRHRVGEHTRAHARIGNGYSCAQARIANAAWHRHPSKAAAEACTDPACAARLAAALERGTAETARIDGETIARLRAGIERSTAAWVAIAGQISTWQAEARQGLR